MATFDEIFEEVRLESIEPGNLALMLVENSFSKIEVNLTSKQKNKSKTLFLKHVLLKTPLWRQRLNLIVNKQS